MDFFFLALLFLVGAASLLKFVKNIFQDRLELDIWSTLGSETKSGYFDSEEKY